MSVSIENFVKTIYALNERAVAKTSTIADELKISNAAVTDMAKKLCKKEYVNYEKYKSLSLTKKGKKLALSVIRKHRLWELFLYTTFDFSLEEIHYEAELLEHQTSNFLLEKMDAFLNYPKFDPHGDPIPDVNGKITVIENMISLSDASENKVYTIIRLNSSNVAFFEICRGNEITIQQEIVVLKNYIDFIEIKYRNKIIVLPKDIAKYIEIILT